MATTRAALVDQVETFLAAHALWQTEIGRPEYPDAVWWNACEALLDAFSVDVPGQLAEIAKLVNRLCAAQGEFDLESGITGNPDPPEGLWDVVGLLRRALENYLTTPEPTPPPSVRALMAQPSMTAQAVCRTYGGDWLAGGDWDRPQVDWVQAEMDNPGSMLKDHPPRPAGQKMPESVEMGPHLLARSTKRPPTGPDDEPAGAEVQRLRALCEANGIAWHPAAKAANLSRKLKAAGIDTGEAVAQ